MALPIGDMADTAQTRKDETYGKVDADVWHLKAH